VRNENPAGGKPLHGKPLNGKPVNGKPVNGHHALAVSGEPPNTGPRLIAIAVSLAGSVQEVRAYMRSTEADFLEYCAGAKELAFDELDRLITFIVREQGKIIAQNRDLLQRVREKR
jgi:hypothetical protein